MTPTPRLLLTIDYESWFAPSRRYDHLPSESRRRLDNGFARRALDPILQILGNSKASFYLVGEMAEWYPELPEKIANAGHEVGFHCHVHRRLDDAKEVEKDLAASSGWLKKYGVRGYRAPMVHTVEEAYPVLEKHSFTYSSSIYAPAGTALKRGGIWEIPVSTLPLRPPRTDYRAPRHMNLRLLFLGEFPYGSSFTSGLFPGTVFKIIERAMRDGKSPVIFLHPYEIVPPRRWRRYLAQDLLRNPLLFPFILDKSKFLKDLLKNFPTSTMQDYVKELAP